LTENKQTCSAATKQQYRGLRLQVDNCMFKVRNSEWKVNLHLQVLKDVTDECRGEGVEL